MVRRLDALPSYTLRPDRHDNTWCSFVFYGSDLYSISPYRGSYFIYIWSLNVSLQNGGGGVKHLSGGGEGSKQERRHYVMHKVPKRGGIQIIVRCLLGHYKIRIFQMNTVYKCWQK